MARPKREIIIREFNGDSVQGVICCKCSEWKSLDNYGKDKTRSFGIKARCKPCESASSSAYKARNRRSVREYNQVHYAENKELYMELQRKRRRANPQKESIYKHNRRARIKALPNDVTASDVSAILTRFNGRCALSDSVDVALDHFIPISSGFGGTTIKNLIPLDKSLNASKSDNNPFEWFEENKERLNLDETRFMSAVYYLAEMNDMSCDEFKAYVYTCFSDISTAIVV